MGSRALKSAFWYTGSNLLVKAIGFVTVPIFTRILTHEEFGIYNNYLSWLAVATIVVTLSLEATLISAKRDFPNDLRNYTFSMLVLSQASALVWLLVANLAMCLFETVMALDSYFVNAIFVYLIFMPAVTLLQTWERFVYRYKITVALSLAVSIGASALSVALGLAMTDALNGVIAGRTLPVMVLGAGITGWFLLGGGKIKPAYWRYAIPIAWPFIPHLLAMTLLGAMNKMFITQMCGADANALYSIAYSCGLIVSLFVSSLNSAFSPWLGDRLSEGNYQRIRRISRPYVLVFAVGALLVSLLAPELLLVMGGPSYMPAVWMIPPISIGCVFQFVYCMYVNVEQFEKKTKGMALASLTAAGLNAALDYFLIPSFGYMAAAWATAISYAWLMIVHYFLVRRMGLSNVFDGKAVALISVSASIAIGGLSLLYPFAEIRWILFSVGAGCVFLILWKNRLRVADLLKR